MARVRRFSLFLFGAALVGWTLTACTQSNPLASPAGGVQAGLAWNSSREMVVADLFFSPTSNSPNTLPPIGGTAITMGMGGKSKARFGNASVTFPNGNLLGGLGVHTSGNVLIVGPHTFAPFTTLCPSFNCRDYAPARGIGGVNGDFASDFFMRYTGYKGPSPAYDYSSVQMPFAGAPRDMSAYRGIIFWARGEGNFAVNLNGNQPDPYSGYNLYLKRFGNELAGRDEWKEIIVYFEEMVQEYGLAADKANVLKKVTGLQFDQQAPYTADFQLDLDYIRFFK